MMLELARVDQIIADFCAEVISEPLCYFSEADLQGLLFAKLTEQFPRKLGTSVARGPESKSTYRTGVVHREYGLGQRRRMDIVLFTPHQITGIDSVNLQREGKYVPPSIGIELGTEKTRDSVAHTENDMRKLSETLQCGYLIYFFRDATAADLGTKTREKTEEKITRILRTPLQAQRPPTRVKVLGFLLRLSRRHKRIWGKCELFDPNSKRWRKISASAASQEVLKVLRRQ